MMLLLTSEDVSGTREHADPPRTRQASKYLQTAIKARSSRTTSPCVKVSGDVPVSYLVAIYAVAIAEKSLQIGVSRRADSNRGPLHYE